MEKLDTCPVCASNTIGPFLTCTDYTVSKTDFEIAKCGACGFVFTNPRPTENECGKYYQSEDYISHSNTRKGLINKIYAAVRTYSIKKKEALVSAEALGKTILDYGCGTGEFLNYCKANGWNCTGIEPATEPRELGIKNYGLNILPEPEVVNLPEGSFDIITLWHVLEHVYPLHERIENFKRLLKPGGTLIIAVPNHKSKDAQTHGRFWAAYDVPRHIYHFDRTSIKALFSSHGFKLVNVKPMVFDAYYISMVSEGYNGKTGIGAILNGFLSGLKSNNAAKKTGEYSSLIYVIKKV